MEEDRYRGRRWGNLELRIGALEAEAAAGGDEGAARRPFTILFPENLPHRAGPTEQAEGAES